MHQDEPVLSRHISQKVTFVIICLIFFISLHYSVVQLNRTQTCTDWCTTTGMLNARYFQVLYEIMSCHESTSCDVSASQVTAILSALLSRTPFYVSVTQGVTLSVHFSVHFQHLCMDAGLCT